RPATSDDQTMKEHQIVIRSVLLLAALLASISCSAAPTKVGCFTEKLLLAPGIPPVIIATFDEDAKSVILFANELGGLIQGEAVDMTANTILFTFHTKDGRTAKALLFRVTGSLSITFEPDANVSILANCRKTENRF